MFTLTPLYEDILVSKDFLTAEEQALFTASLENISKTFVKGQESLEEGYWIGKSTPIDIDPVVLANINARLQSQFPQYSFFGFEDYNRMDKNDEPMPVHWDNNNGIETETIVLGFNLYLSDFHGGDLYYPEMKFTYHPEKFDLVVHPATKQYKHQNTRVIGNKVRWNTCDFAHINEQKVVS